MSEIKTMDGVAIDGNHIALIKALVMCSKPKTLLEIGIGSGSTTSAILEAIESNQNGASLTCVDNFIDWGGKKPDGIDILPITLIEKSEKDFILENKVMFDFIVSDADHNHSHEWIQLTLSQLNRGGVAVFHDVTNPDYPNLRKILEYVSYYECDSAVFNASSKPEERCHRGMLVVFKHK